MGGECVTIVPPWPQHNISVQGDVPLDIIVAKKILLPIMHEAKRFSSAKQRYNLEVQDDKHTHIIHT